MKSCHPICPLCGGANPILELQYKHFILVRCEVCNLVYADPLEVPPRLYEQEYVNPSLIYKAYFEQLNEIKHDKLHITWSWRKFFNLQTNKGRLLDIGCSTGAFMIAAKYRGFEPEGLDISAEVARTAHEATGLPIHIGMLQDLQFPSGSFDVVTSWEVLEHVPDPISFGKEILRILKPNGVWALSTPNWRSRWERVANDVAERRPPFHLVYWSPDPLRRLYRGNL